MTYFLFWTAKFLTLPSSCSDRRVLDLNRVYYKYHTNVERTGFMFPFRSILPIYSYENIKIILIACKEQDSLQANSPNRKLCKKCDICTYQ